VTSAALVGGLVGGAALFLVIVVSTVHLDNKKTAKWIVRHLQKSGKPVELRSNYLSGAWNPSKPDVAGRIMERGRAAYTLDDAGIIHLRFQPTRGPERHLSGPVPDSVVHESPAAARRHKRARHVFMAYAGFVVAGFLIGYFTATGPQVRRVVAGGVGVFLAMVAAWLTILVLQVALAVVTSRQRHPSPSTTDAGTAATTR
jgi:hypothetical protein